MNSTKHTPIIRLQAARRSYEIALEACPHWDYESDGGKPCGCCCELEDARRELSAARHAAKVAA